MKCCGSPTRDPDTAGCARPRCPQPALLRPRARPAPQPALLEVQQLFNRHAFWASNRLVGLSRTSSDGFSCAVQLIVMVSNDLRGHCPGRRVIKELLHAPPVVDVVGVLDNHQQCRFLPPTGLL